MPLFLLAFPEQVCGTLYSENFGVRKHQHLLSPQSWIWVFSCSVSQENRADLPSSSSYFRSLTKCCKNTDKLTVICILSKRLYGWYRNQSRFWLEYQGLRLSLKANSWPCPVRRISMQNQIFSHPYQITYLTAQRWVDHSCTWEVGQFIGVYAFDHWTWTYQVYLLTESDKRYTNSKTPHCSTYEG